MKKIIQKGAEAILYLRDGKLVKERVKKSYRNKVIDVNKRKYPTRREGKLLNDAKKIGVNVPKVLKIDDKDMKIEMEFLKGKLLRDNLGKFDQSKRKKVCNEVGMEIGKLHDNNIIHGDLTTSNMFLVKGRVYFIDFGLGFYSTKVEDKAVDIHLLRQALESKHYKIASKCFKEILNGYKKSGEFKETLKRLEKVEKRGRYKRKK